MDRRAAVPPAPRPIALLVAGVLLAGCGTETATNGIPERTRNPRLSTAQVAPSPLPPKPTCPPSGASITAGDVEAALGHRAVVLKLTNCRSKPITVNGYPAVTVLDAHHKPMKVAITHGLSYMAIDPGPTKIHLHKGESVLAAVSWSNTVGAGTKSAGTYLSIAKATHEPSTIWPVATDLGTTGKLTLTAWCRKFPT
ncbi:DUF4232 domain-containing protein [Kribbella sp. NPDC026611]|uniref:DUF4232 domain-containing protein n=1 Tax=Kribbella sp. NPDC026611 TaxID=3154911 RepID=UPI0033CAC802